MPWPQRYRTALPERAYCEPSPRSVVPRQIGQSLDRRLFQSRACGRKCTLKASLARKPSCTALRESQPFGATISPRLQGRQAPGLRDKIREMLAPQASGSGMVREGFCFCFARQIINHHHAVETRDKRRVRNIGSGIKPAFVATPAVLSATTKTTPSAAVTSSPVGSVIERCSSQHAG